MAWAGHPIALRVARALLLAGVVLAMLLGGCATPAPGGKPAAASAGGANVQGVVVDAAVHPVANASITLSGAGTSAATASDGHGAFVFRGLAPGAYVVRAHRTGFTDGQTEVEVKMGAQPRPVRLVVLANALAVPSVDVYHFVGYIECNLVAGPFFVPCQAPVVGSVNQDRYRQEYNMTGNVTYVQATLDWTPTYPGADQMYFNLYTTPHAVVAHAAGPPRLVINVTGDARAFSNSLLGVEVSSNGVGGVAGGAVEQSFDVYVVVTHNFQPPDGYLFLRDGTPAVPQ